MDGRESQCPLQGPLNWAVSHAAASHTSILAHADRADATRALGRPASWRRAPPASPPPSPSPSIPPFRAPPLLPAARTPLARPRRHDTPPPPTPALPPLPPRPKRSARTPRRRSLVRRVGRRPPPPPRPARLALSLQAAAACSCRRLPALPRLLLVVACSSPRRRWRFRACLLLPPAPTAAPRRALRRPHWRRPCRPHPPPPHPAASRVGVS